MKKTLNMKKLKKKNTQGKKTQRSNGEDSVILSGNDQENNHNDELDKQYNNNNNNSNNNEDEDDEDEQLNQILKTKDINEKPSKKVMTTLELNDLKIQQELLDIADSARSKDSFGPWLPPPKQSMKARSQSKNESRIGSRNAKSSISQKNILNRPHSTQYQYTEDHFQHLQSSQNQFGLNPISQIEYNNGFKNGQSFIHSQTQENISQNLQNTLLGNMGNEARRQIASVKNINFSELDALGNNNNKQSNLLTENDSQDASISYHNKVFRMSPSRKGQGINARQILEKRIQTQQSCDCSSQRLNSQQSYQQQMQQQSKKNKIFSLNEQNDSIQCVPLFPQQQVHNNNIQMFVKPHESQKNCYNMPMRSTLPKFLKKTAIKIKSDYNQYIKGHSQNNIYNNNGKTIEEQQKRNQDMYYQEISDLLNKTINTFNFNNVIDTNEAELNRLNSQNSQVSRYSPIIKSKKSQSPTKRFSLEPNQQNAPQIKISSKQQYRMSHQGIPINEKDKNKSQFANDDLKSQSEKGDDDQLQNFNQQKVELHLNNEERAESNSPSYRQTKKGQKNVNNNINRILLEIQQTAATDESNQGELSNRNLNLQLLKQKTEKDKIPIVIKQMNGSLLTINPHAVMPFTNSNTNNNEDYQRMSLASQLQKDQLDKKGMVGQKFSQSRPISQQKGKKSRDNSTGEGNKQISIQFKLSYHRGKSLISQHQNERNSLSVNGICTNNTLQAQNSIAIDQKNNNNSSAVQRKISQVMSQISNNDYINQSGFMHQQLKGKPSNFLRHVNTQYSDEYENEEEPKQHQYLFEQQNLGNKNKDEPLQLNALKNRRVLSAHSNHPEEKKRFSLQTNNLINHTNEVINQAFLKNNILDNSENNLNQAQNNNTESILAPRTIKSPFMNYKRQLSNVSQNSKSNAQQPSRIRKNLSFDNEGQVLDKDNPQNFMSNVDAQLLFNTNALEFNGRSSLQSQEYQKKRQSYLKPSNSNNPNQKSSIPKSNFISKAKQNITEQKIGDLTSLIPIIDCKKIL